VAAYISAHGVACLLQMFCNIITVHGSDESRPTVFSIVAKFSVRLFLCYCDNSRITLSLMKFCVNMYIDDCKSPIEFQGHRSKVKVTGTNCPIHCNI